MTDLTPVDHAPTRPERRVTSPCVFCQIVAGDAPATVVHRWPEAIAIVPLDPVVDGHLLVIPTTHVRDALADPDVTAAAARRAAEIAPHPCNLIANVGREATQSVWHLHWHIVPRAADDGLALPWYSGRRGGRGRARPTPHLDAVTAERDKLVEAIGRLVSLPPTAIAEAYGVRYTGGDSA